LKGASATQSCDSEGLEKYSPAFGPDPASTGGTAFHELTENGRVRPRLFEPRSGEE